MIANDLRVLAVLLSICALSSAVFAFFLGKVRSGWTNRRIIFVAALPIPAVVGLFCLYIFLNAVSSSQEACGVDACGMAAAVSVIGAGNAAIGFFISATGAWFVCRRRFK